MFKRNNKITFNFCNICKSKKLINVIDLGYHTPSDTFIKKRDFNKIIPKTKLICKFCKKCLHLQLSKTLSNQYRYNEFKYSYRSSNSSIAKKYWNDYSKYVKKIKAHKKNNILEIGSNDGYLLQKFKKNKVNLYDHFNHLLIHSILHINGYDHKNLFQFNKMKNIEIKILKQFGIRNPYYLNE